MLLRKIVTVALALGLCLTSIFKAERSEAAFPAALAAYGTLHVIMLGTTAAAAAGIISLQQSRAYKEQIASLTRRLSESTGDALASISHQVQELYKNYLASTKKVGPSAKPTQPARDADCKNGVNDDPRQCCSQWFKKSENLGSGIEYILARTKAKAYQVFRLDGTLRCCLEWDSTHARFEVFTPGGKGQYPKGQSGNSYSHKGEFSCTSGDGDPCRATHGDKADDSGGHAPRDGCREGLQIRSSSGRSGNAGSVR